MNIKHIFIAPPFVSNRKCTVYNIVLNVFHITLTTTLFFILFELHRVACVSWACCSVCQSSREFCTSQWKYEPGCGKSCLCYKIMFIISACQATVYLDFVKLQSDDPLKKQLSTTKASICWSSLMGQTDFILWTVCILQLLYKFSSYSPALYIMLRYKEWNKMKYMSLLCVLFLSLEPILCQHHEVDSGRWALGPYL